MEVEQWNNIGKTLEQHGVGFFSKQFGSFRKDAGLLGEM